MRIFGRQISLRSPIVTASNGGKVSGPPVPTAGQMRPALPGFPSNNYGLPALPQPVDVQPAALDSRLIQSDPRELWFLSLPNKLTPQQCLNILRMALGGDLWQQWQLLSLMLDTWHVFRMAQHQLREAVAYCKYNVHPYAEDGKNPTAKAKAKAGLLTRAIKGFNPNPFTDEKGWSGFVYDASDAALSGLCLNELLYDLRPDDGGQAWLPRAGAWVHPRHYTFTPQGYISVYSDDFGRMYPDSQLQSRARTASDTPDPDKFICSQFISRSGSSLGAGFMRPLVWYWSARQFNQEWMLNTAKQFGAPFIELTFKPGVQGQELKDLEAFMRNAGPERRLLHPEGTTATIHQPTALNDYNPQRYLAEEADKAALFLLLGQSATTMATPGKLGQEGTHADVKDERVLGLANWLAHNPLRQLARAVISVNYGDTVDIPEILPDFTKPLDTAQVAQLATAITNSRIPVRAEEFYKKTGFTQPEPGDVVLDSGILVEMGEILTQEEIAQMEQEQALAQAQAGQQVRAVAKGTYERRLRTILAGASKDDLDQLEGLVVKAQKAGHMNGEWTAVKAKVAAIGRNRIQLHDKPAGED